MDERRVSTPDEITMYLENLDFKKKTVGGCDKADVLHKVQELTRMYQDKINKLEEQVAQSKKAKVKAEETAEAASSKQTALQNENEELQQKIESLMEEQRAYEEKARMIADMEMRQKLERNEILIRAEHEAKLIKERAEQDAATIRAEGKQKFVKDIKEKKELLEKLNNELNSHMGDMKAVLRITNEEFSKVKNTIAGLEERLNAYPPAIFVEDDEYEGELYYVEEKDD